VRGEKEGIIYLDCCSDLESGYNLSSGKDRPVGSGKQGGGCGSGREGRVGLTAS